MAVWRTKGGRGSLKSQPPLITVMHPMFVDLHSKIIGGGGGALFSEGGHYSPVNFVLGGNYSPVNYVRGTLFTGELCPGGQYSPVNNVRGDILWGDSVHYDNVLSHIDLRAKTRYTYWNLTQNDSTIRTAGQNEMTTFN